MYGKDLNEREEWVLMQKNQKSSAPREVFGFANLCAKAEWQARVDRKGL